MPPMPPQPSKDDSKPPVRIEHVRLDLLKHAREQLDIEYKDLAEACRVIARRRSIDWVESDVQWLGDLLGGRRMDSVPWDRLSVVTDALGLELVDVLRDPESKLRALIKSGALAAIGEACKVAVAAAAEQIPAIIRSPWKAGVVNTRVHKIGSPQDDETDPIDKVASDVIAMQFKELASTPNHPIGPDYVMVDEEMSVTNHAKGPPKFFIFCDPVDDTLRAKRRIGGAVLISVYMIDVGWIAAAAADPTRMRIYSRVAEDVSKAVEVPSFARRVVDGLPAIQAGTDVRLRPSSRESVEGMVLNVYTSKPARLARAAKDLGRLLETMGSSGRVLSEGGSFGLLLCTDGGVDSAVEIAKGFRPIDFLPGAFLAAGAGATCLRLDPNTSKPKGALSFGPDPKLEAAIGRMIADPASATKELDALRTKFVVAATERLAERICEFL